MLFPSAPLWLKHEPPLCTTFPEPACTKHWCAQQTVPFVGSKGQLHSRANDLKCNAGRSWPLRDLWPPSWLIPPFTPQLWDRAALPSEWHGVPAWAELSLWQSGKGARWVLKGSPKSWRRWKGKNWQRQAELSSNRLYKIKGKGKTRISSRCI